MATPTSQICNIMVIIRKTKHAMTLIIQTSIYMTNCGIIFPSQKNTFFERTMNYSLGVCFFLLKKWDFGMRDKNFYFFA